METHFRFVVLRILCKNGITMVGKENKLFRLARWNGRMY